MEKLQFIFQLFDKISGPAGSAEQAMKSLNAAMGESSVIAAKSGSSLASMGGGFVTMAGGVGAALGGLQAVVTAIGSIVSLAADAISAVANLGFSFARAGIDALAFKESTIASFEVMLGSAEKAKGMFATAAQFAKLTPFASRDVVASFQQLITAGFKETEVPIVFQAVGDLAAARGFDKEIMGRAVLVMGQIKATGKLMGQDLMQLTQAGVSRARIFDNVAKNAGVARTEVEKMMHAGDISADLAIMSVLQTIQDTVSGGELGQGMVNQSKTLKGIFSQLGDAFESLFIVQTGNDPFAPGTNALKGFLENLVALTGGPAFKKAQDFFAKVFNGMMSVFEPLGGAGGKSLIDAAAEAFLNFGEKAYNSVVKVGGILLDVLTPPLLRAVEAVFSLVNKIASGELDTSIRIAATGFGMMLDTVTGVVKTLTFMLEKLGAIASIAGSMMPGGMGLAAQMVSGLVGGLGAGTPAVEAASSELATASVDAFAGPDGIYAESPSKKFRQLGEYSVDGYTSGVADLATKPAMAAEELGGGAGGSGGRMPFTVTIGDINVNGSGDPKTTAEAVRDMVLEQLGAAFETAAMQAGVA